MSEKVTEGMTVAEMKRLKKGDRILWTERMDEIENHIPIIDRGRVVATRTGAGPGCPGKGIWIEWDSAHDFDTWHSYSARNAACISVAP